ncbi:MAG TPA: DnaB-like helicase C-terminal domain-containing protein [Ignavibacteriaceae bacterium]|nr:DnaB-like helicase C-terminal domain-containing protein [Ignavibacteriaceae bacterium]
MFRENNQTVNRLINILAKKQVYEIEIISDLIFEPVDAGSFYTVLKGEYFSNINRKIFELLINQITKGQARREIIILTLKENYPEFDFNRLTGCGLVSNLYREELSKCFLDCYFEEKAEELLTEYQKGEIIFSEISERLNTLQKSFPFMHSKNGDDFSDFIDKAVAGEYEEVHTKQFPFINRCFGSFEPGNIVNIGAKSGTGKSLFGLQLLFDLVESNKGKQAVYYSLEMPVRELKLRLVSSRFNINPIELRNRSYFKKLKEFDINGLKAFSEYLDKKLYITDKLFQLNQIITDIKARKKENPNLLFVTIDYINLIQTERGENRYHEIGSIMQRLKQTALEEGIIFFAVSQLNRSGEIADSYTIIQNSDIALSLERPLREEKYAKEKSLMYGFNRIEITENLLLLHITKNRHTSTLGTIPFTVIDNNIREINTTTTPPQPESSFYDNREEEVF